MDKKSTIGFFILIILIFVIPYFYRKNKEEDISKHRKYSLGKIYKKTGSLKNGSHWYYTFFYNEKSYEEYQSTDIRYDVNIGDYLLIEFSSNNPNRSKALYEYQLREDKIEFKGYVGDTIPYSILDFRKSNGKIW